METGHSQLFADTDDVGVLRERLYDTAAQLQAAARMGLELIEQNQAMQRRLERLELEHEELAQRVSLAERDRRWMQEQSLRVDQLRASVGELVAQAEGGRTRRGTDDRRVCELERTVDTLRLGMESLAHVIREDASPRPWVAEIGALQRALGEVRRDIESLTSLVDAAYETRDGLEAQQRARHADMARQVGELASRAAAHDGAQDEMRARLDALCEGVVGLDDLLQSVVADYHTTLTDHEQAIRSLTDSHAELAEERRWAARQHPRLCTPPLPTPQTATGHRPPHPTGATPAARPPRSRRAPSAERCGPAAGDHRYAGGERLDDIFASIGETPATSSSTTSDGCSSPPPLPVSMADELAAGLPEWPSAGGSHPRKAASMVASSRRRASRPRISSFSQLPSEQPSPRSPATVAGFSVISAPSHVGVGWGNYWNARHHRAHFGLQQRLNISIAHGERPRTLSAPSTATELGPGDLAAAD
ncbi:hypothetical protein H4R21_000850 [Coemansia helicoidea]|uniref:Uncharacterized protein n=1 Tax=Coemansia helicoidea TaxID=1286919 RepID=A0ACC1LEI3_9FUNG|nr:hypothetical protein H4R21_000850 [Coemansia helicoidea]